MLKTVIENRSFPSPFPLQVNELGSEESDAPPTHLPVSLMPNIPNPFRLAHK